MSAKVVYGYDLGLQVAARRHHLRRAVLFLAAAGAGFAIGWRSGR